MNTISAREIKRRGISALDELLKDGPVHVTKSNQPTYVVMSEKDYVRPLSPAEIAQVRAQIGTVRCNGCGASVDLGRMPACSYCGARVEALDPEAIRRAIAAPPPARPAAQADTALDRLLAAQHAAARPAHPAGADLVFGGLAFLLDAFTLR